MEDTYEDLTEAPKPEYLEINSDYIYPAPNIAVGEEGIDKASQTRQNSKCSRKVLLISLLAVILSLGAGGCIGWYVTNTTIGQQITPNEMEDDIGYQNSTSAASITKSTTILNVVSTASPTPTLQPNECIFDQNGVCDPTLDYWCLLSGTLLCKSNSDGWLVWFRRVDDTVDFKERNWTECTQGFGDPNGNYWLGLEKLHLITGTFEPYKMRVELESWSHPYMEYAEYDSFYIKNKESNYEFHISGFTGNTSIDALRSSGGSKFSATDKDNDYINARHCAQLYGPWWHHQPYCSTNINAMQTYGGPGSIGTDHMSWNEAFAGLGNSRPPLKSVSIKIKSNSTIGQRITPNDVTDDVGPQSLATTSPGHSSHPTPILQPNECIFDQNGVCDPMLDYWCLLSGTLLCKPNSDGWLVWFRRVDDTIDFKERNWTECTQGFGDPNGNYWLGLEKLHLITGTFEPYKMRVELESWSHPYVEYAEYDSFYIKNKESNYEFHISGFTGNTSVDALFSSGGSKFSATDKDNDYINDRHCAQLYGPWWHHQPYCSTNINAMQTYGGPGSIGTDHMSWNEAFAGLGNKRPPLKSILFKITLND